MSHFVTVVLVPEKSKNPEEAANYLLDPYDENLQGPERYEECYCRTEGAARFANDILEGSGEASAHEEAVERMRGELRKVGDAAWELVGEHVEERPIMPTVGEEIENMLEMTEHVFSNKVALVLEELIDEERELADRWRTEHQAWRKRFGEVELEMPGYGLAKDDCDDCGGTGWATTTLNPKGKWDWWTVGGRWTGIFDPEYKPWDDPRNLEPCFVCGATGMREDELGREAREKDPTYRCNGCDKQPGPPGQRPKFPTGWVQQGNMTPTPHWVELMNGNGDREGKIVIPFAVVTPDGQWHQSAEMGWWGMTSDEVDPKEWERRVQELARENPDTIAVACDLHV